MDIFPTWTLRAAREEDAAAISCVHVESWRSTYKGIVSDAFLASLNPEEREGMWAEKIVSGMSFFVALEEDTVVGFVCGGPIRESLKDYDAELFAIYLLERAQRKGIGSALRQELARELRGRGFKKMIAWVLQSNDASVFYKRSGGRHLTSKSIEIGGEPLAALAYGWDLESPHT